MTYGSSGLFAYGSAVGVFGGISGGTAYKTPSISEYERRAAGGQTRSSFFSRS